MSNSPKHRTDTLKTLAGWSLVTALYIAVAASTFGGFFSKWAFRDGDPRQLSLVAVMDGTAQRPFIYRQLIPWLTASIVRALPAPLAASMAQKAVTHPHISDTYARATDAKHPTHALAYRIAYHLVFLAWLGALALLAFACYQATQHLAASTIAPLVFAHTFPFLQTQGGYYYDPVEVAFFAASMLIACSRRFKWLIVPLAPLATLNKESYLIWLLCLVPFYWEGPNRSRQLIKLGAAMALSGAVYGLLRLEFANQGGASMENHLANNLKLYATLSNYFATEHTYALAFPDGVSVVSLAGLGTIVWLGWRHLTAVWRRHLLLSLAISLPLFIAFCWHGELRNLSFLFVGFVVMLATIVAAGLDRTTNPRAR